MKCVLIGFLMAFVSVNTLAAPLDAEYRQRARLIADHAIEYLRSQQDEATGGWRHNTDGPNLPAISGLVITGMLLDARIDQHDESVARGIEYILSFAKEDGGIHDGMLQSYNTSICLILIQDICHSQTKTQVTVITVFFGYLMCG